MKILFVCLGNICRSPLAEGVMAHLIKVAGRESEFELDSAGTGNWHTGELADPRSRSTAKSHGFVLGHRARTLVPPDFDHFDLIIPMDWDNYHNLQQMAKTQIQKNKIKLMRDWDPLGSGEVPDPYYGTLEDFEEVYQMVHRSCEKLLISLPKSSEGEC